MSAPTPASGSPMDFIRTDSHNRKASLVVSAAGATGQIPNGGPVTHSGARPNIAFGSMGNSAHGSPAPPSSSPYPTHNNNLPPPLQNPRMSSPAHSPSPIPQPPASGGKPPSGLGGQGSGLVFGNAGYENGDSGLRASQGHNSQSQSLRREPSQSGHGDMNQGAMHRGYAPPVGRGRGGFNPNHGSYSPNLSYRNLPNSRGPPVGGQYGPQQGMPYRGRGSPAVNHAQPHMQGSPNNPYGGYPQHLGPQGHMYGAPYGAYDPQAGFYSPYYQMQGYPGAPPSPRPGQYQAPYGGPPHQSSPYTGPASMSRSASQASERPASSMGSRPPTNAGGASQNHTPAPTVQTPGAASSNFQIPSKTKSKAITIKNAAGEEISFPKKAATPAPASATPSTPAASVTATTPAAPSSTAPTPTPPPRTPSTSETTQTTRTEPRTRTDGEIKNSFQEQVRKQYEAQKEAERKAKGEPAKAAEKPVETTSESASASKEVETAKAEVEEVAKEAAPKTDAEASAQADNARVVVEAEKAAEPAPEEDEAARKKREEDEAFEREIAEMEAREREEEERERAYNEKKAKAAAEKKQKEAEAAANADAEMKRLEKEAEELELKRERERDSGTGESDQSKADKDLFASLKKPTFGPGAMAAAEAEKEEDTPAATPTDLNAPRGQKAKPASLKLNTDKPVEPPQPTAGMQALKTARLLDLQTESITYPEGIQSPNPALNNAAKNKGRQYDKSFLLQFQDVFKEKPTVDWDQKVKDTLGDGEPASARGGSSRQGSVSMSGRQPSKGGQSAGGYGGPMGSFGGARTLPPGTSSMDRFAASNSGARNMSGMGGFGSGRGGFPVATAMSRSGSMQPAPPSPRPGASKGKGSRRGDRAMSRKEEETSNKIMPLTAGMELKALEKSSTGWTARSIGAPMAAGGLAPDGMMPPDMVQRKVKAALNKMTPEKFDKISDQIMVIANQSKNESDGRTLRQVIALTFEKACDEAHWAGMYARFCQKMLTEMSNEIVDQQITKNGQPVVGGGLFRKYLLNRCQEDFEHGWEANLPPKPEGETQEAALLSDDYYVAAAAKRKGLGLIQFIGELYKLGMLTYRIMHQCVMRLLDFQGQPDESNVENLCKLLRTVGSTMDTSDEQSHGLVNAYFDRINNILDQHKDMPSRSRFMLMDVIDMRKNRWQDKTASKGPKTIQEIHAEAEAAAAAAEAERQKTRSNRPPAGRGDARAFSQQGMPPPDYPRNQVGMDDLRRLQQRNQSSRTASSGLGPSLGPGSSLYAGRTASGRKGLGPPRDGDASGATSRTNTPPIKGEEKKDTSAQANSFSALAALGNQDEDSARSPPLEKASPAPTNATPSIDVTAETGN